MDRYKNEPLEVLVERAKELECLYLVDEALTEESLTTALNKLCEVIPFGFRNMDACVAALEFDGKIYGNTPLTKADEITADILVGGEPYGSIRAMYPKKTFKKGEKPFLDQEDKLLKTIANRVAESVYKRRLLESNDDKRSWEAIIKLLQKTDHDALLYICEKMLALFASTNPTLTADVFREMDWMSYYVQGEINFPVDTLPDFDVVRLSRLLFDAAGTCLDDAQIYNYISLWIYQGKTYELIKAVNKKDADVKSIANALAQYLKAVKGNEMASEATKRWLTVELMQRFLTENAGFIKNAQKHISIEAFHKLLETYICSARSIGKIGGKGTGFFVANQIVQTHLDQNPELCCIKMPRTWYLSAEEFTNFIESNGLDELNEHKYLDILEIRTSYPRVIRRIKSAKLSSYVLNGLDQIIDGCEDRPLIVRSSSLLEDQVESAFSGKYKSLFLANTGSKTERKNRLIEGILEVYASLFNPDAIQYKKERNLLDCREVMGIMIQEVVGKKVGPYYFPLFAGVAFGNNELCWSPRIKREDGLVRMVMGLGTRAVDRVGDDFPILVSPGQPTLRVNHSPDEIQKYSPQNIDVIDLEKNKFVTLSINTLIKKYAEIIPLINLVASVRKNDMYSRVNKIVTDFKNEEIVITFNDLIEKTPIVRQIGALLVLLKDKLGYPVDIEFAGDGENIYLLQCRAQSRTREDMPVAIPGNISPQSTVFTADKHISNGIVTGIRTVVYVDPTEYANMEKYEDYLRVAEIVRELNTRLERKSFILMGPGRWGSRGDIKLGVPVTYSDINNTAMLIEIAAKESANRPDLSFGTHFFQDLVEENIRYLPLYPEDRSTVFNTAFFMGANNELSDILPAYSKFEKVVRVIRVDKNYADKELIVLMNAQLETAVAYLDTPAVQRVSESYATPGAFEREHSGDREQSWKWRHYMAEQIATRMDMEALGVKGVYLFGSTNSCTARLNSDIDLLLHLRGEGPPERDLEIWLEGWSRALAEINFLKTGYKSEGLLDVHYVTDKDIREKSSYAMKINSVYDPAFPLRTL